MFNRPVPLKTTATATKHGGGVARGGGPGGNETFRGKFKKFEKRNEVQDPSTFAGQEVSPGCYHYSLCVHCIIVLNARRLSPNNVCREGV